MMIGNKLLKLPFSGSLLLERNHDNLHLLVERTHHLERNRDEFPIDTPPLQRKGTGATLLPEKGTILLLRSNLRIGTIPPGTLVGVPIMIGTTTGTNLLLAGDLQRGTILLLLVGDLQRGTNLLLAGNLQRGTILLLLAGDLQRGTILLLLACDLQRGAIGLMEILY